MSWYRIRPGPDSAGPSFGMNFPNLGPFVIYKLFQYDCYSQILNKSACAVSVLRKLGPCVTNVTNATSEQINANNALMRACEKCILARQNLGLPHRTNAHATLCYTADVDMCSTHAHPYIRIHVHLGPFGWTRVM